jgi:nucleoside-diphosphate-sugar epimerase
MSLGLPDSVKVIVGERKDLDRLTEDVEADVVLDMVCGTEYEARDFVKVFEGRCGRSIILSSVDVYRAYDIMVNRDHGTLQPTPISENGELRLKRYPYRSCANPIYKYYDKVLVEEVALHSQALPATILRLPVVYGPGVLGQPFCDLLRQMDAGAKEIPFDSDAAAWKGCWSYIDNVASAIALATLDKRATSRVYNIGDSMAPTFREWLEHIASACGWKGTLVPADRSELLSESIIVPNPLQDWHIDTRLIREELGFKECLDLQEAMALTVSWSRRTQSTVC